MGQSEGISVIIPTYNREKFIAETIQSVIDQEYDNLEIIISDDGSTDRTIEIAESFNDKVKILHKPKNFITQGVSSTRNRGIKASTQPYICFLDSDDFFLPGHLIKIANVLENNSNSGFAFCRILNVKEEDGKILCNIYTHLKIFKNDIRNPIVSRSNIVCTNCFIFRKEVFETVGRFNESYSNGEDGDLWMRISEKYTGVFSDHYGAVYRKHLNINQLTNNSKEIINRCALSIHENALKRYYDLELKDLERLFRLKHILLFDRYRNETLIYLYKYLYLILQYPITFLRRIPLFYYELFEIKKLKKWYELEDFLNRH